MRRGNFPASGSGVPRRPPRLLFPGPGSPVGRAGPSPAPRPRLRGRPGVCCLGVACYLPSRLISVPGSALGRTSRRGFWFFFFCFWFGLGFFLRLVFFFFLDVGKVSFAPGWLGVQVRAVGSPQGSVPFFWGRCACAEVAVAVLLQAGVDRWTLTSSFPSKSHSLVEKTAVL